MQKTELKNILVIDIETVPQFSSYNLLPEKWKPLWEKKMQYLITRDEKTAEELYERAGIYSEFGKIVCISVGFFIVENENIQFRIKSFYGDDEKTLLTDFCSLLEQNFNEDCILCAHNGKEFDYPYIARRCVINGINIPKILNYSGKKPWEVKHLDTLELWKFGDYKNYTSLELLTAVFNLESPKEETDGSQIWKAYWIEKDLEKIKRYCQGDVIAVAQLLLKINGFDLLKKENIIFTN